jgi:hypothetical protein
MVPSQDAGQDIQTHTDIGAVKILPCSSYTFLPASAQMCKAIQMISEHNLQSHMTFCHILAVTATHPVPHPQKVARI